MREFIAFLSFITQAIPLNQNTGDSTFLHLGWYLLGYDFFALFILLLLDARTLWEKLDTYPALSHFIY